MDMFFPVPGIMELLNGTMGAILYGPRVLYAFALLPVAIVLGIFWICVDLCGRTHYEFCIDLSRRLGGAWRCFDLSRSVWRTLVCWPSFARGVVVILVHCVAILGLGASSCDVTRMA